jgi:hypothetical protein
VVFKTGDERCLKNRWVLGLSSEAILALSRGLVVENKKPSVLGEGFFSDKEITVEFGNSSIYKTGFIVN